MMEHDFDFDNKQMVMRLRVLMSNDEEKIVKKNFDSQMANRRKS